ncbi:hypothetical protein TIFTF001_043162 [Ficus carica]|uniref:Transmembrane protein n=1 Tax=Ficus carica TaxID=3494 RepID=A0AA88CK64_FICCA|nr:hypothetical protein TIFTF001_043162 [Ficus carica]
MSSYNMIILAGFVETLRETYEIFVKKGKLIPSITLLFLFLSSIFFLSNFFSIKPLLSDLILKFTVLMITSPTPGTPAFTDDILSLKEDLGTLAGIEWIFIVANSLASLFFSTATIITSAAIYGGKETLHIKDLLSTVGQTWRRPFVTLFYTTLFDLGYIFFVFTFKLPLVLVFDHERAFSLFSTMVSMIISIFYLYISVVWTLAIVISVLEEKSGIKALGKAAELVKGMKIKGFCIKLLFGILFYIVFELTMKTLNKQYNSLSFGIVIVLLFLNIACLVKMLSWTAYTVFYYECKKTHGEEEVFEMEESEEYTKIASHTPPINEDIP